MCCYALHKTAHSSKSRPLHRVRGAVSSTSTTSQTRHKLKTPHHDAIHEQSLYCKSDTEEAGGYLNKQKPDSSIQPLLSGTLSHCDQLYFCGFNALLLSLVSSASLADRPKLRSSVKDVCQSCAPAIVSVSSSDARVATLQLAFAHSLLRRLARQRVVLHLLKLIIALVIAVTYIYTSIQCSCECKISSGLHALDALDSSLVVL